jgi:hypothetical protein
MKRKKKQKHVQDFGFKFHNITINKGTEKYQVIHQTATYTYAVPVDSKGLVGGGVEKFLR